MVYDLSQVDGKPIAYITEEQPQSGIFVEARIISRPLDIAATLKNDTAPAAKLLGDSVPAEPDGDAYEWIGVTSFITAEKNCCWVLSYEDFYTSEQYDSRNAAFGAGDGFCYKRADFSLNLKGKVYDGCRMLLVIRQPDGKGTEIEVYYRVPGGYDGCILGFHNSAALTQGQLELGRSNPAACLGYIERAAGDVYLRLK